MGANPFMNPNQRGVELPPGCKDLMDVLKIEGSEQLSEGASATVTAPNTWCGWLSEIERYVGDFLEPGGEQQVFMVGIPERGFLLILAKRSGGALTLNFS